MNIPAYQSELRELAERNRLGPPGVPGSVIWFK